MRRAAASLSTLVCVIALALIARPACADSITLRIMLWGQQNQAQRRPDESPVARYQPDHGSGFILDRSVNPPLLRFEDSPEVWILQAQPGPRGDTIYRNDIGQPMLRATKLGGLTLFTDDNPDGEAAAYDGEAASLHVSGFMPPSILLQRVVQASLHSSRAAQRVIPFSTVDDATPETAALVADTATVTAEAIGRVARLANGRTTLTRVLKVLLAKGRRPDAHLQSGSLTVTYAPNSAAGLRPSSERILQVITH